MYYLSVKFYNNTMSLHKYLNDAINVLNSAKLYLTQPKWLTIYNKDGTLVHKKDFNDISSISCFILQKNIAKPKMELVNKIWNVDENIVKKNDPEIKLWKKIEEGDYWKVCYQINSTPFPIWNRDLSFVQTQLEENNIIWLVAYSIEHPNIPLQPNNYVRANIIMSIWKFVEIDKNNTEVTRIIHVEPKGNIPAFFINSSIDKHIKLLENLEK